MFTLSNTLPFRSNNSTLIPSSVTLTIDPPIVFPPSENLYANKSYDSIFEYNLRVYIANLIALPLSVWLNSKLYYEIKKIKNNIALSNIFSIVIIELLENIIFGKI